MLMKLTETVEDGILTVRLNFLGGSLVGAGKYCIDYDTEVFSLISVEEGAASCDIMAINSKIPGKVRGNFYYEEGYQSGSTEVVVITLQLKKYPVSKSDINISEICIVDKDSSIIETTDTVKPVMKMNCEHIQRNAVTLTEADCHTQGIEQEACVYCGNVLGTYYRDYHHSWGEWRVDVEPTCEEDGEKTHICAECGATETVYIDALNHNWGEWRVDVEPTCEEDGEKTHVCADCGKEETVHISALNHDWYSENPVVVKPTDTEDGSRTCTCSRCGRTMVEDIPVGDFYEDDVKDGMVHYTMAGNITSMNPLEKKNELTETEWEGVYSLTVNVPAFDEEQEWLNRFIILQIDDTVIHTGGWSYQLCLGTDQFAYNQTRFRIECEQALENVTVYYDVTTGAVVILDQDGNMIDYHFSWGGWDAEEQFTTVSEFATCGYEWPAYEVMVDSLPNIAKRNEILYKKIMGTLTDEDWEELKESESEQPVQPEATKKATVTYHFYNALGWEQVGAWVREGIGWEYNVLPLDRCILKDTDDGSETDEPIWPGALMEEEGGNWYKITCYYDDFSLGSMMLFNNYVGDSTAGDVTSEADIQKLRDAGIRLNDMYEKQQSANIMIKKNTEAATDYYINWAGDMRGSMIVFGKSDMITTEPPENYTNTVLEETIYGDANGDGMVNSSDAVLMKRHLAGWNVEIDEKACDVNMDGTVDSADVVLIQKKLAGYQIVLGA